MENEKPTLKENFMIHLSLILPISIFIVIIMLISFFQAWSKLINSIDKNTLASISATLAGFLLTAMNIIFTMKENRFIKTLRKTKLFLNISTAYIITIISLLICVATFTLSILIKISIVIFLTSIFETGVLTIYMYKIFAFSRRSG